MQDVPRTRGWDRVHVGEYGACAIGCGGEITCWGVSSDPDFGDLNNIPDPPPDDGG